MLDLPDLRRTPKAPQYRQYGGVFVRFGKASNGSPPKRRTVLTVPEMDWIVDVLGHWVTEVRPLLSPRKTAGTVGHRTVWPACRCARSTPRSEQAREAAGCRRRRTCIRCVTAT